MLFLNSRSAVRFCLGSPVLTLIWYTLVGPLSGCSPGTFDRLPGQDRAEQIVWRELYGETDDPPAVEWVDGEPPCGSTWLGWKVRVEIRRDLDHPIARSAYPHELMHWHTFNRTGDVDAAHWRGDWELADQGAFKALWAAGL